MKKYKFFDEEYEEEDGTTTYQIEEYEKKGVLNPIIEEEKITLFEARKVCINALEKYYKKNQSDRVNFERLVHILELVKMVFLNECDNLCRDPENYLDDFCF